MQIHHWVKIIVFIQFSNVFADDFFDHEENLDHSTLTSEYSESITDETTLNLSTDSTESSTETNGDPTESSTETNDDQTDEESCLLKCMVNTTFGSVIGCENTVSTESLNSTNPREISVYSFKGIRYAEPPVGELRFRETRKIIYSKPTNIDATKYGKACIQPILGGIENFLYQSEDCLNLNIYTTSLEITANLPVMVFIPGGAFLWGSNIEYDGTHLSIRGVVIVVINYRLGAFGFFCTNSSESPGNQGLYDQTMALKWTVDNIRAFGGNPNKITLFGESAGSMSVSNLIVSSFSNTLFSQAILQSGASMVSLFSRSLNYSNAQARRFASNSTLFLTGKCDGDNWIDCLRKKSALEILAAQSLAFLWNPSSPWYSAYLLEFVPCYGDAFMPLPVNKSLEMGNFRSNVSVIIGHNQMEGTLFTQEFDIVRFLGLRYQPKLPDFLIEKCSDKPISLLPLGFTIEEIQDDIKYSFFGNKTNSTNVAKLYTETFSNGIILPITSSMLEENLGNSNIERSRIRGAATHMFGDYLLTCPTVLFGLYLTKSLSFIGKVYQYRLTYANSQSPCYNSCWCNVTHADDIPLVFGFPYFQSGYSDTDRNFSSKIMDIWTEFAKKGDPGKVNGHVWPTYTKKSDGSVSLQYIELNPDINKFGSVSTDAYAGNEFKPNVIMNCINFWDELLSEEI